MNGRDTLDLLESSDLERLDTSLLDIVDHVLGTGVVLRGELILGVAGVDLIYIELRALLCAADRILPKPEKKS